MTFTTDITKRRQVGELRSQRTLPGTKICAPEIFSPGNLTVDIKVLQLLETGDLRKFFNFIRSVQAATAAAAASVYMYARAHARRK